MKKENFNKLPKWAQLRITVLERNITGLKEELNQINGKGKTNTFIEEGFEERPLPDTSKIKFKSDAGTISIYMQEDGNLNINANGKGGYDMCVKPRASNSIFIKFIDNAK